MMKKAVSALIIAAICCVMLMLGASAVEFSDIDGHWAEDTINEWKDNGVISGYPDGSFRPDTPVSRGELAKILTLAFDLQETSLFEYNDVNDSQWYYPYLTYSAQYIPVYALPSGFDNNMPYIENPDGMGFLPECKAMRMHVAEALVLLKIEKDALGIALPELDVVWVEVCEAFGDFDYHNIWTPHPEPGTMPEGYLRMFNYTWLAKELELMQGNAEGYFLPYDWITRAELLTIIDRASN